MKRREFVIGAAGAGAAMASLFPAGLSGIEREAHASGLERRALGRTGEKLSVIGFGGIVVTSSTAAQASERCAPRSTPASTTSTWPELRERRGHARAGSRALPQGVFLACKTQGRTKDAANAELESSLRKMRTDHFDLYQHHAVTKKADVATILGPGGAMEAFEAAKKAGKVRFVGFSAHSVEAATALMDGYAFDTILFPVNYATWHAGGFGPQVLAKAQEKGMGILCLKALAKAPLAEGAKNRYEKCWYEPFDAPDEARQPCASRCRTR